MRRLILDRLELQARVGILEQELRAPQRLIVSVLVELPQAPLLPPSDEIHRVFDYCHLRDVALEEAGSGHINLLETLAGRIVQRLLSYPQIGRAVVRVDKPGIFSDCQAIGVEIEGTRNIDQTS